MAALIGRHVNKIDRKGRVSVPKPFRDALAGQDFFGIYVFRSFKFPSIEGAGAQFIDRIVASLDDLDMFSDDQDDLAAAILEDAQALPFDSEGRVILPKNLLDYAGISGEAVFVGRGNRFQIWQPAAYEVHREQAFQRARSRGATLKLRARPSGDGETA